MEFLEARCPSCGGLLQLPNDKKQVKCMYCSVDIVVSEAVNNEAPSTENLLRLGSDAEKSKNYQEAYDYFTRALENEPENPIALIGKAIAAIHLSSSTIRYEELIQGLERAFEYSSEDQKHQLEVDAAEKIAEACSDFASYRMTKDLEESYMERTKVLFCLKLAHGYDANNTGILSSLYGQNKILAHEFAYLNAKYDTDTYVKNIAECNRESRKWLSKLKEIDPESAEFYADEDEDETEEFDKGRPSNNGTGCLLAILVTILIIIVFIVS